MSHNIGITMSGNIAFDVGAKSPLDGGTITNWADYNATGDKTPVEFSSVADNINVVPIDASRTLLVYEGGSDFCRARIATVNISGIVTFGTESTLLAAAITDCKADLLDNTHAIVTVESGGDVKCIAIEFSGTSIDTVGSAVSFVTVNSDHLSIAGLSGTEFFMAYKDTVATDGVVFYGSVSGTTVTAGTNVTFESVSNNDLNMTRLTSTTAIIVHAHGSANDCEAELISINGTAPQVDDTLTILNGSFTVSAIGLARISDTQVITSYSEFFSKDNCEAVVITESGGTLSKGTAVEINADSGTGQSIALPNTSQAVCTVERAAASSTDTTVVEIADTTLTALTAHQNLSGNKTKVTNGEVGSKWVMVGYRDGNDSNKGKVIVLGV